ncbi:MAG: peptidylprolyl isomerase [Coriobacteriales bacterium]|jgi:foldase protein PrsA|nr:peptidylprolyl isomerase [Coriobacteriales bacterium]
MRRFKKVIAVVCAGALAFSFAACGSTAGPGVAATVNGVEISEERVTNRIEATRTSYPTAETWAAALSSAGYTPETLRARYIDDLVDAELLKQYAVAEGITVDEAAIDAQIASTKETFVNDAGWLDYLSMNGYNSEEEYRDTLISSNLLTKVNATLEAPTPTDEELQTEVNAVIQNYAGKRSSHILLASTEGSKHAGMSEEELIAAAQKLIDQLDGGADFAALATENSDDTGSAALGGDVGWSSLTSFADEYQQALDGLAVGQLSAPIVSQFGVHVILCTEEFVPSSEGTQDIATIPTAILDYIKSSLARTQQSGSYATLIDDLRAKADIVVNPMPEGLPYAVDMSLVETPADPATETPTDTEEPVDEVEGTEGEEAPASETPAEDGAAATTQ